MRFATYAILETVLVSYHGTRKQPHRPVPLPLNPTAIHRRRKQLIAFQAWQQSSQATAPLAEEEPQLEEDSSLAPNLTRSQIRKLFHRHLSRERIDLALEQLSSLGLIDLHTEPGRGRHSTLGPESMP